MGPQAQKGVQREVYAGRRVFLLKKNNVLLDLYHIAFGMDLSLLLEVTKTAPRNDKESYRTKKPATRVNRLSQELRCWRRPSP